MSVHPTKINLSQKLARVEGTWSPKIIGAVNSAHVKLVKVQGEFAWHHHDVEDELFLVLSGRLVMRFRDGEEILEAGEMIIIPHGLEHQPAAEEETHILLFEPATTLNTGTDQTDRTVIPDWI